MQMTQTMTSRFALLVFIIYSFFLLSLILFISSLHLSQPTNITGTFVVYLEKGLCSPDNMMGRETIRVVLS